MLLPLIIFIFITPGILGYFTKIVRYEKSEISFLENTRKYLNKFVYVSLVIGLPIIIFNLLVPSAFRMFVGEMLRGIVHALTIYVIPIVFLKELKLDAIPLGIKFLFKHFRYSLLIFLLSFVPGIIKILYILSFSYIRNMLSIIFIGYISSLISTYIIIIQFLAASMFLLERGILQPIKNANRVKS
jgi:hypothetical protein